MKSRQLTTSDFYVLHFLFYIYTFNRYLPFSKSVRESLETQACSSAVSSMLFLTTSLWRPS